MKKENLLIRTFFDIKKIFFERNHQKLKGLETSVQCYNHFTTVTYNCSQKIIIDACTRAVQVHAAATSNHLATFVNYSCKMFITSVQY
jgi:hypothetical protein